MPCGLLYFFDSGTNDDKTTFADVNEQFPNPQPLILNGDGSVPNCFYSGSAKVILVTNVGTPTTPIDGTQQWERDPVTSAAIGAIGREWDAISIYDKDSVVILDDIFYVSIINANQNNNPSSTPTAWSQWDLLVRFNIFETYQLADPVIASDGFLYTSSIADNTGNDPTLLGGQWSLPAVRTQKNILFGNFRVNQRNVSGTVVLSAGEYGHDMFKGGSSGCTYTFATSANVTTVTISDGSLIQIVEGINISSGTYVLSWTGSAQGQIDGGGFDDSGLTGTLTGGTNATIEFDTGTVALPQLEEGSTESAFDFRPITEEQFLCQRYFRNIFGADIEGQANSTTTLFCSANYNSMRAAPTLTLIKTSISAPSFELLVAGVFVGVTTLTLTTSTPNVAGANFTLGGLTGISLGDVLTFNTGTGVILTASAVL